MSNYFFNGSLSLSASELGAFNKMLNAHDRAGFYMTYHAMTGSDEALLQARIATFSEQVGGAAFAANWLLTNWYGRDGTETQQQGTYPGIYFLSQAVAEAAYQFIAQEVESQRTSGLISDNDMFTTAEEAWRDQGILGYFPGNILYADGRSADIADLNTPGALAAFQSLAYASYTGKRSSDFGSTSKIAGPDGSTIVLDGAGHVTAVFTNKSFDSQNVLAWAGSALSPRDDDLLMTMLDLGEMPSSSGDPAVRQARIGFSEFNTGYNGDPDPIVPPAAPAPVHYSWKAPSGGSGPTAGASHDVVAGGRAADIIDGQAGDDIIIGAKGQDKLTGGSGSDILWGQNDKDELFGGDGADVLRGGRGNDVLSGGAGDDLIDGGDIAVARRHDGRDAVSYKDAPGAVTIDFVNLTDDDRKNGVLKLENDGLGGKDTLHSIEIIELSTHADNVKIKGATASDEKPAYKDLAIFGDLGVDTFTIDLAEGEVPAILMGGGDADVFDITARARVYDNSGESTAPTASPVVLFGGEGSDTFNLHGAFNVSFLYVSDPDQVSRLDIDKLAARYAKSSNYADFVLIVNPEAGDTITWNGKPVQGATATVETNEYRTDGRYFMYDPTILMGQGYLYYNGSPATQTGDIMPYYLNKDSARRSTVEYKSSGIEYWTNGLIYAGDNQYETDGTIGYSVVLDDMTDGGSNVIQRLVIDNFVEGNLGIRFTEPTGVPVNYVETEKWHFDINSGNLTRYFGSRVEFDGQEKPGLPYRIPFEGGMDAGSGYIWTDPKLELWTHIPFSRSEEDAYMEFNPAYRDPGSRVLFDVSELLREESEDPEADEPENDPNDPERPEERFVFDGEGDARSEIIVGSNYGNILRGRGGDDTLRGRAGADNLNGDDGTDTASYKGSPTSVSVSLDTGTTDGGDAEGDVLASIENLEGSSFADTLEGSVGANELFLGGGNDVGRGLAGSDVLWGQAGSDDLDGGQGTDRLFGGSGNDKLTGGLGDDLLNGGVGGDLYVYSSADGSDRLIDLGDDDALDTLRLVDLNPNQVSLQAAGSDVVLTVLATGARIVLGSQIAYDALNGGTDAPPSGGVERIEFADATVWDRAAIKSAVGFAPAQVEIAGTNGADALQGDYWHNLLLGYGGDDVISGFAGDDRIAGGDGADTLSGGAGDDIIVGGAGPDSLDGSDGTDMASYATATAGVVVDLLSSSLGTGDAQGDSFTSIENLDGSRFADTISMTETGNLVRAGAGNDELHGRGGDDRLLGEAGDDTLYGGAGHDELDGGEGQDVAVGAEGDDAIALGTGDDVAEGGGGNDTLDGGEGVDQITFATAAVGVSVDLSRAVAQDTGVGLDLIRNFENLTGSTFADRLAGDSASNLLAGLAGGDTFVFGGTFGHDAIADFTASDTLEFTDLVFADVNAVLAAASEVGNDVVIDAGASGSITLRGLSLADLTAAQIVVPVNPDAPDIVKPQATANTGIASAVAISASSFDLMENAEIGQSTLLPHATVLATASGQGQEYYAVQAGAGDRFVFDIDHGSFDTVIRLLDGSGTQLASNDDNDSDPGSSSYNSLLEHTFQQAGTYYLAVGSYGSGGVPSAGATYSLHVSVEAVPDLPETVDKPDYVKQASVANTSNAAAIDLAGFFDLHASPDITQATILPHATVLATAHGGASELYAVNAAAGARAIFDIDGASFDTIIDLLNGSGQVIASNDDSYSDPGSTQYNSLIDHTFGDAGTYYLRVRDYASGGALTANATYNLHVSLQGAPVEFVV